MKKRVWLEVDLDVLSGNYGRIAGAVRPCVVIGVLKANAYGLGVGSVARSLYEAGCRCFGVADLYEALELRAAVDADVQVLGGLLDDELEPAVKAGIIIPVADIECARMINSIAESHKMRARCQFLIDSGMGRLGMPLEMSADIIREAVRLPALDAEGIYSHFPMAYRDGSEYTNRQISLFLGLLSELADAGIVFRWRHIANSDAINNFPRSYAAPFNAVRSGINLHGCFDKDGQRMLDMRPSLTLKSRLIAVRRMKAGDFIGYGCSYRLERDGLVGVVAAGYADGLPLALSNRGSLLVKGRRCAVLGRVSMDYTSIALDGVEDVSCGDEVVCLGRQGKSEITVDEWARLKGTHSYDIICSFGTRVERCYTGGV